MKVTRINWTVLDGDMRDWVQSYMGGTGALIYNVDPSMDAFMTILLTEIQRAYPGAVIEVRVVRGVDSLMSYGDRPRIETDEYPFVPGFDSTEYIDITDRIGDIERGIWERDAEWLRK